MGRPKKDAAIDLTEAHDLTAGLIERLSCDARTKAQVFLRDRRTPGLSVRATNTGSKSFVFEAKLKRQTIRRTIGSVRSWTIEHARAEANRLRVLIDTGSDPREVDRQREAARQKAIAESAAARELEAQQNAARALTVETAWRAYVEARTPRWGSLHLRDHLRLSDAGGKSRKRAEGTTKAGPLAPLMSMRLIDLTAARITEWAATEATTRPAPARLSWRLLRAFLAWCNEQPAYASILQGNNVAKSRNTREALGRPGAKRDALQREQLPAWFAAVQAISNPAIAAYLQALLLTGARPGELLSLQWKDVNTTWRSLTIHDKVEGERVIPLTRYVHHLIANLPRRNAYVFAGVGENALTRPAKNLTTACVTAGVDHVSLHGLRRSFKSLTEWLEVPVGVVAQVMGHKPSATAERHYTVRPLDLLRVHHERIEAWILEQAGIEFNATTTPGALRAVA